MKNQKEQIKEWADDWEKTIRPQDPEKWDEKCARCSEAIDFNPYNGDSYCGCWCKRWWCCEAHAKLDGWIFRGDSYDTDHISCNHCRK